MKTKLRDIELLFELPASYTTRHDLGLYHGQLQGSGMPTARLQAAALLVCARPTNAQQGLFPRFTFESTPAALGAACLDHLHAKGYTAAEIMDAGHPCLVALLEDVFPSEPEVKASEDFSEAPEAGGR